MEQRILLSQLKTGVLGAAAIFKNGRIEYANHSFNFFYNNLKKKEKNNISGLMSQLKSELIKSGKQDARKFVDLITNHEKIEVIVCLLDTASMEDSLLLVVPAKELSGAVPFFNPGRSIDFDNSPKIELSPSFSKLIGEDFHFKAVLLKAQKAAQSDYPILIRGESGTGKEILASTIHKASRRRQKKFVDINCAAIPEQLIDSELFGYEKGAFTGALPGGRHGMFVEANHGTLFLDEIADASLPTQAKLLRVLNEGYFKRVGGTKNIEVDVRIISATNKDLLQMIEENRFRQDLIYRLNTITLNLPALRERRSDIPLLAEYFLKRHAERQQRVLKFSANCLDWLCSYHWPGNVRELKGVIDYMVTMATGHVITQNHFPDFLKPLKNQPEQKADMPAVQSNSENGTDLLAKAVQHAEKQVIKDVLKRAKNRSNAIDILGISRGTFYAKLKLYNIE